MNSRWTVKVTSQFLAIVIISSLVSLQSLAQGVNENVDVTTSVTTESISTESSDIKKELEGIKEELTNIKTAVKSSDSWDSAKTLVALIFGLMGPVVGGIIAFCTMRSANQARNQAQHEQYLLDSLKWFDEHTTGRGIGIAIIDANWKDFPQLQPTWTQILVWQSIYLLSQATRKQESTEMTNLQNMQKLLKKGKVSSDQQNDLRLAIGARKDFGKGIVLEDKELEVWKNLNN